MASGIGTLQGANPALGTAARLPQTSQEPAQQGAPFVRISRKGAQLEFDKTGNAFSANVTDTLKPVGGYHRSLYLDVIASGGSANATGVGAASGDAPYNVLGTFLLRDPFGTPIINLTDGFALYLVDKWGAQSGGAGFANIANRPSFSNINTTTGAFKIPFTIPFELDSSGFCSMIGMSSAAEPQYQIALNASTTVYQTSANFTTAPTVELQCYSNFWAAPISAPTMAPPDIGSTAQWQQGVSSSKWSNSTNQRIQAPRVGTFLHTIIAVLRDTGNANVRIANYPTTDLTLYIDGIPYMWESFNLMEDRCYDAYGLTVDTGVAIYTFNDDIDQTPSLAQTHDRMLYTTPSTLLEIGGTSGSTGTGPDSLTWLTGELWAAGGIPYQHLSS